MKRSFSTLCIFALLFLACDTQHETKLPSHLVIINKCCKGLAGCQEEILLNTAEETAVQTQEEDADAVLFLPYYSCDTKLLIL